MMPPSVHAILTPPGAAGIAVHAATAPGVLADLAPIFRPARSHAHPDAASASTAPPAFRSAKLYYGHVLDGAAALDEVIVAVFLPPDSPTTHPLIEVNCHGGTVPVRALSDLFSRLGVPPIEPDQFLALRVHPARDAIQLHAERLALAAPTTLAARHLFWQASGILSRVLERTLDRLKLDPSQRQAALDTLRQLLQTAPFGIGLHQPRTITVVGRPNVGKSTLSNKLIGADRSLVHPTPGTTRDAVSSLIAIEGVPIRLVDTAGLRPALDQIEAAGVRISLAKLAAADLGLWIFDHSRPLDPIEAAHLEPLAGKSLLTVVNKMDLPGSLPEALHPRPHRSPARPVSPLTRDRFPHLPRRLLLHLFGPVLPPVGSPLIFTESLRDALARLLRDPEDSEPLASFLRPVAPERTP